MNFKEVKKVLGPGILFAATAIGVSHLVQSTTAGAFYGFSMAGFILAANLFKYPFFEFASRYTAVTKKSTLQGYYEINPVWLKIFVVITMITMFFVTAAVGMVTIGFMENLFHISDFTGFKFSTHFLLIFSSALILIFGKFNLLENIIKILAITLLVTTLLAFVMILFKFENTNMNYLPKIKEEGWLFIIPLMGWMPTAIDLSAWTSLWTLEKLKQNNEKLNVKNICKEFSWGYLISAVLALVFMIIGALLFYGKGIDFPTTNVGFSAFIIQMYEDVIGSWAGVIISIAAFSIMFSTFITIIDGYSRTITTSFNILRSKKKTKGNNFAMIAILSIVGLMLIIYFESNTEGFKMLINLATSLSFIVAPFIAILNYKLVQSNVIGEKYAPNKIMKGLSIIGICFLTFFTIWYFIKC